MLKIDPRRLVQRFDRLFRRSDQPFRFVPKGTKPPITIKPATDAALLQRLADPDVIQTLAFNTRSTKWEGPLEPDTAKFMRAFLKALHKRGLPFYVVWAFRKQKDQQAAFKAGASRAQWGESPHNFGYAIDVIHFRKLYDLTNAEWVLIAAIGYEVARKLNIKVRWGGDWDGDGDIYDNRLYDPAHWEIADWRERVAASK